ncbi:murein transglycosylase [Sorangium cellulosum]|uniref:Murein transglycosylase n=1 Tax=Sorangium cellulosum TaxID=56 RepID=A0A2L0EQ31_SORCE|nr:transglycosylase SLT domain-containing protein [Sorangium cellulosum]AUX41372.1 murein transglycosylase [Sorangium cellulosum]
MPVKATSGSSLRAPLRLVCAALGLAALALHPGSALADIFTYTDADGTVHFSNRRTGDGRFKLYIKGDDKGGASKRAGVAPVAPSDKSLERFSRYDAWIRQAAALYQIPEELVRAVIKCESDYDPRAVSPVGAQGLMQLMPETALRMQVRDAFDARENIFGGTRYLRILANLFNGDLDLTIAGYNAGEGAVMRYGGIPPYEETQAYVTRVRTYYARYRTTRDATVASIEP